MLETFFIDPTQCTKEVLDDILRAAGEINGNIKAMKDTTIISKIQKGEISIYAVAQRMKKQCLRNDVIIEAIKERSYFIKEVPDDMQTEEMCLIALGGDNAYNHNLNHCKVRTKKIFLKAVENNDNAYSYFDMTNEMWKILVRKYPTIYIREAVDKSDEAKQLKILHEIEENVHKIYVAGVDLPRNNIPIDDEDYINKYKSHVLGMLDKVQEVIKNV